MLDLGHYTTTITATSCTAIAVGMIVTFLCQRAWVRWPAYSSRVALIGSMVQLAILLIALGNVYSAHDRLQNSMENVFHGESIRLNELEDSCVQTLYRGHLPNSLECAEYHFQATRQILIQTIPLPISSRLRDAMVVLFAAFNGGLAAGMLLLIFSNPRNAPKA